MPVTALLAQASGGYAGGGRRPGEHAALGAGDAGPVFDDDSGLVQVTGTLTPGQRVVVASS